MVDTLFALLLPGNDFGCNAARGNNEFWSSPACRMIASGRVMRDSALQPPIQGGKSASEITSAVKKRTYFQRLTRIVGFVTLINEIFLSKAQTLDARKASKPHTAPRSKAG
jgi:hypothetical protein